MSLTTVILTDTISIRKTFYILHEETIATAASFWEKSDKFLMAVQDNSVFAGRTRWCDLEPTHFQMMILLNIGHVSVIPDDEQEDLEHPAVKSLVFLLSALVYCLHLRTGSIIEILRIHRYAINDAKFDFSATLNIDIETEGDSSELFQVIVDNE